VLEHAGRLPGRADIGVRTLVCVREDEGMAGRLHSINVGTPVDAEWAGSLRRTAIAKTNVAGPVEVHRLGVAGDEVADTKDHGGVYQAVYAFAREDLDAWSSRLGRRLPDGMFGENLTTEGLDVNEALIGEQWRIGTTVVQVASIRIPCVVFQNYLRESGYDSDKWIKRFTQDARPGPYLQVVQEGVISVGDAIEVVHKPGHGITVSAMFKAFTTDRPMLRTLLEAGDDLIPEAREAAEAYTAAHT
jgi:MOSC domain-containing protein YiiM